MFIFSFLLAHAPFIRLNCVCALTRAPSPSTRPYVSPACFLLLKPCLSDLWAVCASPSLSDSFMPVQPLSHPIKTSPPQGSACLRKCVFVCVEYRSLARCLSEAGLHKAGVRCQKYFTPNLAEQNAAMVQKSSLKSLPALCVESFKSGKNF